MTLKDSNNDSILITTVQSKYRTHPCTSVCLGLCSRTPSHDSGLSVYGGEQVCRFTLSGSFFHRPLGFLFFGKVNSMKMLS